MTTDRSLLPLAALGLLWASAAGAATVDTSNWKCEQCPFEKDSVSATLEVGVGTVTEESARFGDYTGLQRQRAHVVGGGGMRWRGADGLYGSAAASDLGLDSRALAAELGSEGRYALTLGYSEIPRHLTEGAQSPYLGRGSAVLTLPAGFPATSTGAMPLTATLQPVEAGYKRSRLDLGLVWDLAPDWSARVAVRRDVRDGLQRTAGSFFSTTSQLLAPLDQVTHQLEASAAYAKGPLFASVGVLASQFSNGPESLTWTNPFTAVAGGSDRGRMALAPDNRFGQIHASLGYDIAPGARLSGDVAFGRMTQDAAYVAATINPGLAASLPAPSLDGRVDTFNANVRLSITPLERLRLTASYARDVHDNKTASLAFPAIAADLFAEGDARGNQPFSFTADRIKLGAELRGPGSLKASLGLDHDRRERTLQEVVLTRENTLWGRVSARPGKDLSLSVKLLHAERDPSTYGIATWVEPAENPLLRKFNLAERRRDALQARLDTTPAESIALGFSADLANDDYRRSSIGLTDSRSVNVGADVSVALTDDTQLHAFVQSEQIRSRQAGSQVYARADWTASTRDRVETAGVGMRHSALKGRIEVRADLTFARSRSDYVVDSGALEPGYPTAKTSLDGLRVQMTYKLQDNVALLGSWWYEHYRGVDWHFDGVLPDTVANLLAFGEQAPRYRVNVVRLALRYSF